jgi:hypothetical protein
MGEADRFRPAAWVRAAAMVGWLAEQRAGLNFGRLDEQEVRQGASRQLGHPIVGDDLGLRVLLADLVQAPLTPLGRLWLRSELIRREVTHAAEGGVPPSTRPAAHAAAAAAGRGWPAPDRHDAAADPAGCDLEALVLPFRQLRRPYPIPGRRLDRMTRIVRPAAMARLARSMAPRLRDIHPVPALRPEEDVFLFRDTGMLAVPVTAPATWAGCRRPTRPRHTRPTVGTCKRCWRIGPGGGRC